MNPKEFSWSEDQQVTVTNPTSKEFRFKVHNKEYVVGAGRTAKMPGYIAWMYVYNIACQVVQDEGLFIKWNEEGFRQTYFEKFVVGADAVVEEIEVEPDVESFDDELSDEPGDDPEPIDETKSAIAPMKARRRNGRSQKA